MQISIKKISEDEYRFSDGVTMTIINPEMIPKVAEKWAEIFWEVKTSGRLNIERE